MKMQLFHIYANKVKHNPFPSRAKYIANKVWTQHISKLISKATSKSVICNLSCVHGANFVEISAFRIWDWCWESCKNKSHSICVSSQGWDLQCYKGGRNSLHICELQWLHCLLRVLFSKRICECRQVTKSPYLVMGMWKVTKIMWNSTNFWDIWIIHLCLLIS